MLHVAVKLQYVMFYNNVLQFHRPYMIFQHVYAVSMQKVVGSRPWRLTLAVAKTNVMHPFSQVGKLLFTCKDRTENPL